MVSEDFSADVEVTDAVKRYGAVTAVDSVSLSVLRGEFVSLLGPSGCGKTTLLRMIAGLETIDGGDIAVGGRSMRGVAPHRRPVSLVFQDLALFPHLTVEDNVAFGPQMEGLRRRDARRRVAEQLELVQLGGLEKRRVSQLSGGQQQRVALARALARRPAVLLLDEPLSSLDRQLRRQLQGELKAIQHRVGTTFVFVTHDQDEALVLSDRIAVMNRGKIEQVGTAQEVYDAPSTPFVASFVGDTNLVPGMVAAVGPDVVRVDGPVPCTVARPPDWNGATGTPVQVCIRPERLHMTRPRSEERQTDAPNRFTGTVVERVFRGNAVRYQVEGAGRRVVCELASREALPVVPGDDVELWWDLGDATLLG